MENLLLPSADTVCLYSTHPVPRIQLNSSGLSIDWRIPAVPERVVCEPVSHWFGEPLRISTTSQASGKFCKIMDQRP